MKRVLFFACMLVALNGYAQLPGFTLVGNPASTAGASWTYKDTINGVIYDLTGILFKPTTGNTFPGVIINHGTGGNVNAYSKNIAQKMVNWGYVCIATNLCHAANAPIGSPGDTSFVNYGASPANMQRAMKCWDILASLGYVDTNCIATFGHSRGAWVTTAIAGTYPTKFAVAGHTAGGVNDQPGSTCATSVMGNGVTAPYIFHHGDNDNTVPVAFDKKFDTILTGNTIPHEFYIYPGYTHAMMSNDTLMLSRTRSWFDAHRCKSAQPNTIENMEAGTIRLSPNPASGRVALNNLSMPATVTLISLTGQILIKASLDKQHNEIDISLLPANVYLLQIRLQNGSISSEKLIKQ